MSIERIKWYRHFIPKLRVWRYGAKSLNWEFNVLPAIRLRWSEFLFHYELEYSVAWLLWENHGWINLHKTRGSNE